MATNPEGAKVIQLHSPEREKVAERQKVSERKWGKNVMKLGFSVIPSLLLKAQRRLGLSATQLAVLLQVIDHWWEPERKPWPSKLLLSNRLNMGQRQVQRHMQALEKAGLIKREERYSADGGRTSNYYDLSGLVEKLKKFEPEFLQVEREIKEKRRQVARPGGLRLNKPTASE